MSDRHFVGLDLTSFENNGKTRPVSRVTYKLDDENVITAGDDTGMELVADNPHATQAMANAILAKIKGYQYQMFTADAANIDPAAELGDGVTAGGVYGVLSRLADDGSGYPDISAPGEAELEDEFPTGGGPLTQAFNRKIADTRSSITKTAEQIRSEITSEVHGLESSFTLQIGQAETRLQDNINKLSADMTLQYNAFSVALEDGLNGQSAAFDVKLSGLSATFEDGLSGLKSEFTTGLDGLASRLTSAEGSLSELDQTLEGFSTRVEDAEGRLSTLEQTATSITSRVEGLDSSYSQLSQTVSGFEATVKDLESGLGQTVRLGADGVTITNAKGSTLIINGGQVDAESLNLTNRITFSDLDKSTQNKVNDKGISEEQATTLITSTLVSSPRIEGADIYGGKYHDADGLGTLTLTLGESKLPSLMFSRNDGTPIFNVLYTQGTLPDGVRVAGAAMLMAGDTMLTHNSVTKTTTTVGTWNFGGSVTGISTISLSEPAAQAKEAADVSSGELPGFEGMAAREEEELAISMSDGQLRVSLPGGAVWYLGPDGWHK